MGQWFTVHNGLLELEHLSTDRTGSQGVLPCLTILFWLGVFGHLGIKIRALIDITSEESSKLLRENKPHLAIPAALQALKFTREVYVVFERENITFLTQKTRSCHVHNQ